MLNDADLPCKQVRYSWVISALEEKDPEKRSLERYCCLGSCMQLRQPWQT